MKKRFYNIGPGLLLASEEKHINVNVKVVIAYGTDWRILPIFCSL